MTNADVVAVDQDPLGKQGTLVATPGTNLEVWSKQLSGTNTRAVALFNRSGAAASISVTWSQIGLPAGAATVRDLYAQKDLGTFHEFVHGDQRTDARHRHAQDRQRAVTPERPRARAKRSLTTPDRPSITTDGGRPDREDTGWGAGYSEPAMTNNGRTRWPARDVLVSP